MTGGADWGKPEDRPRIDLSQVTRDWAEKAFRELPPGEVVAIVGRLRKATAQANSQRAMIDTALEVLKVILKVAVV